MNFIGVFAIFCVFIAAPALVFGFIYMMRRSRTRLDELVLKKEVLELELARDRLRIESMREESRKYDRIIESRISEAQKG